MNEEIKLLLKLTEENTRYETALKYMKAISDNDVAKDYSGNISRDDFVAALRIAGIEEKEINVITFDNCEDVAYAGD